MRRYVLLAVALLCVGACEEGMTEPEVSDVHGRWSGTATLPNAYSSFMDLQQIGTAVSGEMSISGSFHEQPFTGTLDEAARTLVWVVQSGCDRWSGTLTLSADASEMEGAIVLDRSGCSAGSDAGGLLRLTRQ